MTLVRSLRSLFERARIALTVFRKGLPKEDRETDKAVAEFISGQRKPGFPCPRCNAAIVVGIPDLLSRSSVCCSQCGLELRMDWQEDLGARRALENLQAAAVRVDQARKFRG
jgi:hypothetical protein